jgi:putative OPT family oligopeptide transporter
MLHASTPDTQARPQRQLTGRAIVTGMLLGGIMSLSNLYISLKSGWSFGVTITAGILAFGIFAVLARLRLVREHFGVLENNAMQSVASAAGYMTGGGTVAAIPAMMMITGEPMDGLQMFVWISAIAFLGVVMAIPMKQQMINIEGLKFPSGIAAAETLKALHAEGSAGAAQARLLGYTGLVGAAMNFLIEAKARWIPFNLPDRVTLGTLAIRGRPLSDWTIYFETSPLMVAAGAIMGFRAAWSMLAGAVVCFAIVAPEMYAQGVIPEKLGYKNIVGWSVWFGSAMILTSGLLSFAFQWRTVARAMTSVFAAFRGGPGEDAQEVPMSWFFIGVALFAPVVVFLEWWIFGIHVWMGVISVVLSFFIAIVASRATGETDTTPTGALGKITQITYGALDPGNAVTNLMTANVTGGVGLHAADLLTDLKSGYLLKADPRQQFWAQFFGVIAGSLFVVPAFRILVPTAADIGTDKWPAPGAQTWKGVAVMMAEGIDALHPTARIALVVGGALGIGMVLLERYVPKLKPYLPSPTGFGLGFTTPAYNSMNMFVGALFALWMERTRPKTAEATLVPGASGIVAGCSLMGVLIAALSMAGLLDG